jgi:hypothetical protein
MSQPPPIARDSPSRGPSPFVWIGVACLALLAAAAGVVLLYFFMRGKAPMHVATFTNETRAISQAEQPAPEPELPPLKDFSASNVVAILLGAETPEDGLKHLANQGDGRTTVETLDGDTCRFLNRTNRSFGYLYFTIHDTFKQDPLKIARIEIEFRVPRPTIVRLQYDGLQGETHKPYKGAVPEGAPIVQLAPTAHYVQVYPSNAWQTLTFHAKDSSFLNSQNGGADFRLEVNPPHIYVRRVSVTREPPR